MTVKSMTLSHQLVLQTFGGEVLLVFAVGCASDKDAGPSNAIVPAACHALAVGLRLVVT